MDNSHALSSKHFSAPLDQKFLLNDSSLHSNYDLPSMDDAIEQNQT